MESIKVQISARLIQCFKKYAKEAYPREEYGILLGRNDGDNTYTILGLYYPADRARFCTENSIQIQKSWFQQARMYAKSIKLGVIGDIHSHPSGELGPSECDLDQQGSASSHIFGICGITETKRGLRSRIRFWPTERLLKTTVTE